MRRSPAYIETPQIRLPPAVNISHQNIRGVHSEHTQNFIYPSLKCNWPIHTKLLAPNDLISLSYRTQYCVWNANVYYELKKKSIEISYCYLTSARGLFGLSQGIAIATQQDATLASCGVKIPVNIKMSASMGSSIIQSRSWHEDSGSNEPEQ